MNAKKKIIISISAFLVLVTAAIIAVVAVLAAQQVKVRSEIRIYYTSREVVGSVEMSYNFAKWDYNYGAVVGGSRGQETNIGKKEFTGEEEWDSGESHSTTLEGLSENLSMQNNCIEFNFVFENTGYMHTWTAQFSFSELETSNMSYYIYDETHGSHFNGYEVFDVASRQLIKLKVTFYIENIAKDANISGTIALDLKGV